MTSHCLSLTIPDDTDFTRRSIKTKVIEKKYSDNIWQKYMKKTYKNILELRERFGEFRSGRVKIKKKESNGEAKEKEQEKKVKQELGKQEDFMLRL